MKTTLSFFCGTAMALSLGACTAPKIPDSKVTVTQVIEKLEPAWQAPLTRASRKF